MDVIDKVAYCMIRARSTLIVKKWNTFGKYLGIME